MKNVKIPEWVKPTPFLTVDGIIRIFNPQFKGIVLIKEKSSSWICLAWWIC